MRPTPILIFVCLLNLTAPVVVRAQSESQAIARRRTPVVEVFQKAKDAVVNIATTQIIEVRDDPFGFDGFFDFPMFPGRPHTRKFKATSIGSGFVLHPAGYIVTNAHVVSRTTQQKVIFADQTEYDAKIVAIDHERDLAVLKIQPRHPLKPLKLGTSSDLMIGETAIAIGNPLGYQHTGTAGVVSALNRDLQVPGERGGKQAVFKGLIQTDASINPGNSGGPLLNVLGELIGINTAIRADAQNIGFAIPVDRLREILPQMLDVERRYHIIIGLKVADDGGCRVREVAPGSPAAQAGIEVGDVITGIADETVHSDIDYHIAMIGRHAGDRLTVRLVRGGQAREVVLEPAKRPRPDGGRLLVERFGIFAAPVTAEDSRRFGIRNLRGLIVTDVERGGPADRAGVRPGEAIVQIGRRQPASLDEVGELLDDVHRGEGVVIVTIRRVPFGLERRQVVISAR